MKIDFHSAEEKEQFVKLMANCICQTHIARNSMAGGHDGNALARYFAVDRHEASQAVAMLPDRLLYDINKLVKANEADPPGK